MSYDGTPSNPDVGVDLEQHPNAKAFVDKCIEFLDQVQNL
jgi:hypothetical protein